MGKIIKKKLNIKGMHCTSCAMCIDMDLEDLKGICSCQTSYAKSVTEVEFDETVVNIESMVQTIKKSGYTAEVAND